jgi:ABC-2 type transport system permease protein
MSDVFLILKYKLISIFKSTLESKWGSVLKELASIIVFTGFALSTFISSNYATAYLLSEAKIGLFLFHRILSMLLFILFVLVSLGNVIVAYATLYKSKDIEFFLTTPVKPIKIYTVKFLDNFFYSSSTMFIFIFAILLGYGSYFRKSLGFYVFSFAGVIVPFMLMSASLSIIALMLILKLSKKFDIRKIAIFAGLIYALCIYLYFRSTNPMKLFTEVMRYYPDIDRYFAQLDPTIALYLPNHWVAEIFYFSVRGNTEMILKYFLILISATVGTVLINFSVARKLYFETLFIASDLRNRIKKKFDIEFLSFYKKSFLHPQIEVLLKRDLKMFLREPSQWVHLLIMILLVLIFILSLVKMRLYRVEPQILSLAFVSIFSFNVFLVASIVIRFVYPLISLEGMSYWIVRSSPVKLKWFYIHKFIISFFPVLLISEAIAYSSVFPFGKDPNIGFLIAIVSFFITLTYVSLGLGMGGYFANYLERSPVRIASSRGATITLLLGLVLISIFTGIVFVPITVYFQSLRFNVEFFNSAIIGSAFVSFVLSVFFNWLGLSSVRRDF